MPKQNKNIPSSASKDKELINTLLAGQNFLIEISRNFLTKDETSVQINKGLELIGRFFGAGNINLYKVDSKNSSMTHIDRWSGKHSSKELDKDSIFSFKEGDVMYDAFVTHKLSGIYEKETHSDPVKYKHEIEDLGLRSFMVFPIIIAGALWGTITIDSTKQISWTEEQKTLGQFAATLLASALNRQEIERNLIRISSVADRTSQYVAIFDNKGRFIYFNPATTDITEYSTEELRKYGAPILYDPESSNRWDTEIIPALMEKGEYLFELPIHTKTGKKKIMSFVAFTINDGNSVMMGSIATDITKTKQLEEDLRKAKEAAEYASKAKGEFLSRMSHEIRTPINAIMGMSAIAKASNDIKRKDYCLTKLDSASSHLLGIINDILDVSKIEANKMELSEHEFNIEKMFQDIINVVNFRMEEKKQNFTIKTGKDVPPFIVGDEMRLKQVIVNFLSNASKFTPEEGKIELKTDLLSRQGDNIMLRISVKDSGIGLTPEQRNKLFNSFEQADGSISRRFGGTGLGLVISKHIVNLMGGDVEVKSEYGKGAEFICTVALKKSSTQDSVKLSDEINIKNLRILAVDDSADVREYFSAIMNSFGIKCDVAAGGQEALKLIEKNKEHPYSIIFIDWKMPEMDGIELSKRIKQIEGYKALVIMISISAWQEIEDKARDAGIDTFLPKPLFPSSIIDVINKCLSSGNIKENRKEMTEISNDLHDFTGKKILIAEDVDINREIMAALLEETSLAFDFANDGNEAVAKFKAAPDAYDAILMDIQMPEKDGLAATREIRALDTDKAKEIPIIAMTANVFIEDVHKALSAGMNDHLGKPVNIKALFEKLNFYLNNPSKISA
ncbi:PAS domain S-box-containing protein [Parelusimicrobium proximum]|uniref:response regulator n=1 Tax=Parelusimicrobium proximum TaxID=3228953 RepID=UPI003D185358